MLFGRVIPVVRSFISIPAGIFRMPLGKYTLLTIPGSVVWCFALRRHRAGPSGANYARFHHAFDIALVAGAVLLVLYLVLRQRSSRLKTRG